ncbi:PREDICTED: esterase E4-like [Papilio xuthus]|uniref:Esterase E4-like n=1 Tax=Papilio xuthus TaxID=66420 RepID=A0AAJ7EBP3_PAPXU|nr:PREDICTED: esterase E4-like [Papilio xuthus]
MKTIKLLTIILTIKLTYAEETTEEIPYTESSGNDNQNTEEIILTKSGPVKGYVQKETPNIRRFYDIPYGSFSDNNPFEEPSPAQKWERVHDETEHRSRCPQIEHLNRLAGNFHCLTLSIMTPITTTEELRGVLFHIHDGSFNIGSGNPKVYGPEYIVPKGIILVLPNYRLGALGFLCSQNDSVPGNAALKDLTMALKWIKDNIEAFGGDPSNIVVSGEGGGGALAGYLALSPVSRDYVSKVIVESGFVLSHWALERDPDATLKILIQNLPNVGVVTTKNFRVESSNIGILVTAAKDIKFAPCIENGNRSFITETPFNMLNNLKTNMTYMIGTTNHAGLQEALDHTKESLSKLNENFSVILPDDLNFEENDIKRSEIGNRLRKQYFGKNNVTLNNIEELSLCYTDASYLGPMIRAARHLASSGASVYFYEFAFVGYLNQRNIDESIDDIKISTSVKIRGASRGDIVKYIFCQEGHIPVDGSKEKQMIDLVTDLWISFIQSGKPKTEGIEWRPFEKTTETNENWLLIDTQVKPLKGLHVDRLTLWNEIYETYFVEHNRGVRTSPYIYSFTFTIIIFIFISKLIV